MSLAEELSSRDLDTIHKEMEDEEVSCHLINSCFLNYMYCAVAVPSSAMLLRVVWLAM